jgi:hypothetical protein
MAMSGFKQWFLDGLSDLHQARVALPDSIRPSSQPGSIGHPTQMQVNMENGTYEQLLESKQPAIAPPQPEHQAEMEL